MLIYLQSSRIRLPYNYYKNKVYILVTKNYINMTCTYVYLYFCKHLYVTICKSKCKQNKKYYVIK